MKWNAKSQCCRFAFRDVSPSSWRKIMQNVRRSSEGIPTAAILTM